MGNESKSYRGQGLVLVLLLLGLVLTVGLAIGLYGFRLMNKVNYVNPETGPTLTQAELDAYLATEPTLFTPPTIAPEAVPLPEAQTQIGGRDTIHILLVGQDRQENESRARSDSMILCTFHKKNHTLTLTSFLRDLYVQIPGYRSNRLNAAYAAGGMKLLGQTLEKNFGITVHGTIEVDFTRFAELIDLLGGVDLPLRSDEAAFINDATDAELTEGTWRLTGAQALAYARIRKLDADGDFSRTQRQRNLLAALFAAYRSAGLSQILSLLEEALPMLTTDLTREELWDLAAQLVPLLPDLELRNQFIPAEGTYSYKTIRNMAVLVADLEAARNLLQETIGDCVP